VVRRGAFCAKIIFAAGSVLDKSKARFGRLQNSPSAQTVVIAILHFAKIFCQNAFNGCSNRYFDAKHVGGKYEKILCSAKSF